MTLISSLIILVLAFCLGCIVENNFFMGRPAWNLLSLIILILCFMAIGLWIKFLYNLAKL